MFVSLANGLIEELLGDGVFQHPATVLAEGGS
jgi:hypothetical protein